MNSSVNKKKAFVASTIFLLAVIIIGIGSEVFTSKYIADQRSKMRLSYQKRTELTQTQKRGVENESIYINAIDKVMSEKEYQDFKNGLSIIAVNSDVTINKISDASVKNIKDYKENKIIIEAVATYDAFKRFKDRLAKLNYFINFDKETITRENPTSNKIKINAELHVIVFANKEAVINQIKKK